MKEIKTESGTLHTITIVWGEFGTSNKGEMEIVVERFFPCSQADFRKLLKTINMDWEHRKKILDELKEYFRQQAEFHELEFKRYDGFLESRKFQKKAEQEKRLKLKFQKYLEIMEK